MASETSQQRAKRENENTEEKMKRLSGVMRLGGGAWAIFSPNFFFFLPPPFIADVQHVRLSDL